MNDLEREAHIKSCGLLMIKAYREGDRDGAQHWLRLQNEAIKERSPAFVAKLEGCFFCDDASNVRSHSAERGKALG